MRLVLYGVPLRDGWRWNLSLDLHVDAEFWQRHGKVSALYRLHGTYSIEEALPLLEALNRQARSSSGHKRPGAAEPIRKPDRPGEWICCVSGSRTESAFGAF